MVREYMGNENNTQRITSQWGQVLPGLSCPMPDNESARARSEENFSGAAAVGRGGELNAGSGAKQSVLGAPQVSSKAWPMR